MPLAAPAELAPAGAVAPAASPPSNRPDPLGPPASPETLPTPPSRGRNGTHLTLLPARGTAGAEQTLGAPRR